MNINRLVRGKSLIDGRLHFAGGHPKCFCIPRIVKWGPAVSIFWLGAELVWHQ